MRLADLLHMINKQLPLGVTTYGLCPDCGGASRGADVCLSCLPNRYYDPVRAKQLIDLRKQAHAVYMEMQEIEDEEPEDVREDKTVAGELSECLVCEAAVFVESGDEYPCCSDEDCITRLTRSMVGM